MEDFGWRSLLEIAAEKDHFKIVEWLIENGCSVNYRYRNGYSCFTYAALEGEFKIMKLLIENECSLNEKIFYGNTCLLIVAGKKGLNP